MHVDIGEMGFTDVTEKICRLKQSAISYINSPITHFSIKQHLTINKNSSQKATAVAKM